MEVLGYQPSDWYWTIGSDLGNVWSSARAKLVPVSDPAYAAWQGAGGRVPPNLANMAEVEDTLRPTFPRGTPKTYAADARYRKATGGVIITSLSPVAFFSDPVARNTLANASEYAQTQGAGYVIQWKMSDGSFIPLTSAQLSNATNNIVAFVQSCFTCESDMVTGIDNGSITTLAQIDTAFAAISNVFS